MERPERGKLYNLVTLSKYNVEHFQPTKFTLANVPGKSKSWTDLCGQIVKVLAQLGILTEKKLPIYNAKKNGKYFVNSKPRHEIAHLNGNFKEVYPGYFVDAKYQSNRNVNNIIYLFEYLNLDPKHLMIGVE